MSKENEPKFKPAKAWAVVNWTGKAIVNDGTGQKRIYRLKSQAVAACKKIGHNTQPALVEVGLPSEDLFTPTQWALILQCVQNESKGLRDRAFYGPGGYPREKLEYGANKLHELESKIGNEISKKIPTIKFPKYL